MGLLDKIEELQKRPERYRKKVLLVSMAVIMSVVVLVWLSTLRFSLDVPEDLEKKSGNDYSPFKVLTEGVKEGAAKIKSSFSEAINQFESEEEE